MLPQPDFVPLLGIEVKVPKIESYICDDGSALSPRIGDRSETKLAHVNSEEEVVVSVTTSLTEAQLDDVEVEFLKVESTLKALADNADPDTASAWLDQAEL